MPKSKTTKKKMSSDSNKPKKKMQQIKIESTTTTPIGDIAKKDFGSNIAMLDIISQELDILKSSNDLDVIIKTQHNAQEQIKTISLYLDTLNSKLHTSLPDIEILLTDEQYKNTLIEIDSFKYDDSTNIETMIDNFSHLKQKINSCKKYLESKKLEIIEIKN